MKFRWVLVALAVVIVAALTGCVNSNKVGSSSAGFMWVATQGDQMVTSFTINLTTGTASQVGKAVPSGAGPSAMAITPDSKTLFLANGNSISIYTINSDGSLTASSTAGAGGVALAVDPSGTLLFVANQGTFADPTSGIVSIFKISASSLSPANISGSSPATNSFLTETSGAATSSGPVALTISGPYLYVANQFDGTVSGYSYSVDSSGNVAIANTPNSPYAVGVNPSGLAFSRSVAANATARDNFLFVANSGSNDISIFNACVAASLTCANTVGSTPTGLLTPVGSAVGAGLGPNSFVVDPAADFVYAVDGKSNQITQYKSSPATGALTALSPAAASTGSNPISAGVTSNGIWVFVANNGGSNLSAFQIGTAGKLNLPTTPSIAVSNQPSVVLVK